MTKGRKFGRRIAFGLSFFLFFSSWAWGGVTWSLKDYVHHALEHSTTLKKSGMTHQRAIIQKKQALSAFLPTVTLSYDPSISRKEPVLFPNQDPIHKQSSLGINVGETFLNKGQNFSNYMASRALSSSLDLQKQEDRDELTLNIIQAYYVALTSKNNAKHIQEILDILFPEYKKVQKKYKHGLDLEENVLRFHSIYLGEKQALLAAKRRHLADMNTLYDLIGETPEGRPDVAEVSFESASTIENIIQEKLPPKKQWRLIKIYQKFLDYNKWNVRGKQFLFLPNITATFSAGYGSYDISGLYGAFNADRALNYTAQLSLAFTLWRWGADARAVTDAKLAGALAVLPLMRHISQRVREIDSLPFFVRADLEQLKDLEQQKQLAKRSFDLILTKYNQGKTSYLDVASATNTLLSARGQYLAAQIAVEQDVYKWHLYNGDLTSYILQHGG